MKDLYWRLGLTPLANDVEIARAVRRAGPLTRADVEAVLLIPARREVYNRTHQLLVETCELRCRLMIRHAPYGSSGLYSDFMNATQKQTIRSAPAPSTGPQRKVVALAAASLVADLSLRHRIVLAAVVMVVALQFRERSPATLPWPPAVASKVQPMPAACAGAQAGESGLGQSLNLRLAEGADHALVLVYDVRTGKTVAQRIVHPGGACRIELLPGRYRVRAATGRKWFGDAGLFGADTKYSESRSDIDLTLHGTTVDVEVRQSSAVTEATGP